MTNDLAVQFNNVFEKYLVEILLDGKTTRESFTALRDVSFSIRKGEAVAIIGPNGAGKSTILRLIAGLLKPEAGEVKTHGRVGSLLDLGAGFHPELTGRDNLLLNASLYNFSRQEFDAKYEKILAFADIGKFINAPVRCYSQGMYVRLAFSLAIHVDPDILLIDDCLAVGDDEFRVKSLDKALEFKAKNKTIVFITHDFYLAKRMCKRGIYIKNGVIVKDSSVDEAISAYTQPLDVDRSRYKYLAAEIEVESQVRKLEEEQWRAQEQKKLEEEKKKWRDEEQKRRKREEDQWRAQEQRKLEEEKKKWRDEEQKRQKREEDQWRVQKEEWKKEEENKWRGEEEKKRRREKEIKKAGVFLSAQPSFRLNVGQGKVEIIYNQEKMTRDFGMRVLFAVDGIDTDSSAAAWRIRKKSEKHIIVFLKWPRAKAVFQMWSFKWEEGNAINCEMWTRSKSFRTPENERVEFCLSGANQAFDEDGLGNKIRIFYCGEHNKISIETFCEDQVFGVSPNPHGFFMPFFLTLPQWLAEQKSRVARLFFKGKIVFGASLVSSDKGFLASCVLKRREMALDFCEGRCHLAWDQKKITTGFGIYTSLFSRGIWYDSGQAKWRLLSSSVDGLVAEGFWPWIPVSQSWKISRRGENAFEFEIGMRLLRKTTLAIQETVLMLDQAYHHWTLDHKEIRPFPETATGNDFFRFCSWAHIADGKTGLLSISEGLPAVLFKPDLLKDQQVIVESTSHISAMPARLIHCLLSHRNQGGYLEAGDYDFFKGVITLDGEAR